MTALDDRAAAILAAAERYRSSCEAVVATKRAALAAAQETADAAWLRYVAATRARLLALDDLESAARGDL